MDKLALKFGLLLALCGSFVTSVTFADAGDIKALVQLSDEYAATGKAHELELSLKKLAILREEWEALGRPDSTSAQVAAKVEAWRVVFEKKLQPSLDSEMTAEVVAMPYPNEFNGSTLSKNEVVITFDDGPHPTLTPLIHNYIKSLKIPAAFFEVGINVKKNPKLTQGLASEGYIIGNHSWDHPNLTTLDDQKVTSEIQDTQNEIQNALGGPAGFNSYFHNFYAQFFNIPEIIYGPEFFRSPYGDRSARTMNIILNTVVGTGNDVENGKPEITLDKFYHIMWNVDSLDWQDSNPASIEKRVFDQLATYGHHGIILFHDIHPQTVQAIQLILPRLAKEGYKCVSLYDMVTEEALKESGFIKP